MRQLLCLLLVFLTGCSLRMPGMPPLGRDVPLVLTVSKPQQVASGTETTLRVTLGHAFRTLAVPDGWDRAEVALGNPTLMTATQSATVLQSGGATASAVFTGLRPGAGYALTVELYTGATLKARGANGNFSLAAGSQEVTVSMTVTGGFSRIQSVAHTAAPPANTQATDFSVRSPQDLAMGPDGSLYILSRYPTTIYRRAPSGVLTLVGGTQDETGFSGDGGPATEAYFRNPNGLAVDAAGNVYVSDSGNYRIRRIATNGVITTVAGTGNQEISGDGGLAVNAGLYDPGALAFDASGSLYVAERGTQRIRKIDSDGIITNFAGIDGWPISGDGGLATNAVLGEISGMACGSDGSLYFTLGGDCIVRKIAPNGIITTFAGTGGSGNSGDGGPATGATLAQPVGIAADPDGNVYLADSSNNTVRRIGTDGNIATVAGGGTPPDNGDGGAATSAQLYYPKGLAVDSAGHFYIAEPDSNRVRRVDHASGIITTGVGNGYEFYSGDGGPATQAQFFGPRDVLVADDGTMYISDGTNHRIRRVAPNGIVTTIAGDGTEGFGGDGGLATSAQLGLPYNLAFDPDGNLIYCDQNYNRVRRINLTTGIITTIAGNDPNGGYSGDNGLAINADLAYPRGLCYDAAGNLYIGDNGNYRVRRVDPAGIITTVAGDGTMGATDDGNSGDGGPPLSATFGGIRDLTIDPDDNVVMAVGNMVRKIDLVADTITAVVGNGTQAFSGEGGPATAAIIDYPVGVVYDAQGNLYIAASDNYRVLKVDPAGILTTVAGNGNEGAGGNGGAPLAASFDYLIGIGIDPQGRVYVADWDSRLISRIE